MIENILGVRKARQLQRLIRHGRVTFLCLVLTIVVLRGTIGAGKFGTPKQDFLQLRNRFASPNFPRLALQLRRRHSVAKPSKVLLITGSSLSKHCENSFGEYYLLKGIKNKIDYCRLHRLDIFYDEALLEAELSGFQEKLMAIRSVFLAHPKAEFVWWMDSDAMFTNMTFEVPWERYDGYNLVVFGSKEVVYKENSWIGLNTRNFLVRNCDWSLHFIETLGKMGSNGVGEILTLELQEDQLSLLYLLAGQKEKWGNKVFLENEHCLCGFLDVLADKYEKVVENYIFDFGDHRWPLVTHIVGCNPCAKLGEKTMEMCQKNLERTFNFGDNQVLALNAEVVTKAAKVSTS